MLFIDEPSIDRLKNLVIEKGLIMNIGLLGSTFFAKESSVGKS